jgi:prevent-host-death family protein
MTTLTATKARANLFKLMDQAGESHQPIQITGRRHNSVLLAQEDFQALQETVFLLSVPGMKKSLLDGKKAPLKSYTTKRPW